MAPAAKCEGCGETWKTAHEPAAPGEMDALFDATAQHKADITNNIALRVMKIFGGDQTKQQEVHKFRYTYYDTTPAEGFEKAEIVKAE